MAKKSKPSVELEKEIKNLERAIGVMETFVPSGTIKYKGRPVPGLSVTGWKAKLALLRDAADSGRRVDLDAMERDLFSLDAAAAVADEDAFT